MTFLLVMLAISFAVSALGWIYFIYFFSIGYGFSISALAVAIPLMFAESVSLPALMLCGVMFIYGIRLSLYLLLRERRSASYKKILYQPDNTKRKPLFAMFMIWISCALLYVGQMSPVAFYLYNTAKGAEVSDIWAWVAVALAAAGVIIEIVADAQKSRAKSIEAGRFVSSGLYRIVRCPNYFGEIVMWTGSYLLCIAAAATLWQWVIASLGYVGIVYVMFSGARRLELRQSEVYGKDPEFKEYIRRTPLIIPLVPIYSVAKQSWLKG